MNIYIGADKNDMAQHAADAAAAHIRAAIAARGEARIIVATGASQFEFRASSWRRARASSSSSPRS